MASFGRTVASPQILTTSRGSYRLPANTHVYLSVDAIHKDTESWGKDAFDFRPARWLADGDAALAFKAAGTKYLPWSSGPRVCPGMKMAQVEFLSVMFALFRHATVRPAVRDGETPAMASERIKEVVKDSLPRLSLQMNRPTDVDLIWTKRC